MRKRLGLVLLVAATAAPAHGETADALIEASRELLSAGDGECERSGREIVVCADRNANDRYRLPFESFEPGDPRRESVMAERVRLQAAPGTCQRGGWMQMGCGSVGVSLSVGGGGTRLGGARRAY